MIRIRTPSRLHFGLFALSSDRAGPWLNQEEQPTLARRSFGGVGLMIDRPGIEVTLAEANAWSAEGPLAERALQFAQGYCRSVNVDKVFALRIVSAAPEHAGLGTGTQLGLAIARGIACLTGESAVDAITLARRVGRGLRSALGVHGFDRGGFLIEGGKAGETAVAPLLVRCEFPSDWQVLLITPGEIQGAHGTCELDAFAALTKEAPDDRTTEALCRLVLLGLLPALAENDLRNFGEALYDFNRRVGILFQSAQHGPYASSRMEALVTALRDRGVKGVGQSSWGPTIFALVATAEASAIRDWLTRAQGFAAEELRLASAWNQPAAVERLD